MKKDHTTVRVNVLDGEFVKLPADFRLTSNDGISRFAY